MRRAFLLRTPPPELSDCWCPAPGCPGECRGVSLPTTSRWPGVWKVDLRATLQAACVFHFLMFIFFLLFMFPISYSMRPTSYYRYPTRCNLHPIPAPSCACRRGGRAYRGRRGPWLSGQRWKCSGHVWPLFDLRNRRSKRASCTWRRGTKKWPFLTILYSSFPALATWESSGVDRIRLKSHAIDLSHGFETPYLCTEIRAPMGPMEPSRVASAGNHEYKSGHFLCAQSTFLRVKTQHFCKVFWRVSGTLSCRTKSTFACEGSIPV